MRLIDADNLYITVFGVHPYGYKIRGVHEDDLNDAETIDAVPVVRCKDCKYRFTSLCPTHSVEYDIENEPEVIFGLDGNDDFCSFGKRERER